MSSRSRGLPTPSQEQQAAINAILSGNCLTIPSVAGSGKTTTMLQIASHLCYSLDPTEHLDSNTMSTISGSGSGIDSASQPTSQGQRHPSLSIQARHRHRKVTIVTYNRSLSDECRERIMRCGLDCTVWCYTIHGLVSKIAKRVCFDDKKLNEVIQMWDHQEEKESRQNRTGTGNSTFGAELEMELDILMLDEAQDLRPLFYKAICHILRMNENRLRNKRLRAASASSNAICGNGTGQICDDRNKSDTNMNLNMDIEDDGLQMCLVGDPKQMLYDFPTYGNDKASTKYMQEPIKYWGQFTHPRKWETCKLSISYRLTPNMASFVNAFWGTSIQGGNTRVKNLPVEYLCRFPYPDPIVQSQSQSNSANGNVSITKHGKIQNPDEKYKLETSFLSGLIDEYGPENVMLMAQSIKNESCPIRVHVNALCNIKNENGKQKYNFHIKESTRGFEGKADVKNKVRVWTFCGSKGCEADCVVVFGLDVYMGRVHSLNQVGVALSRAKKRLVVIHGMNKNNKKRRGVVDQLCRVGDIPSYVPFYAGPYYPLLGDVGIPEVNGRFNNGLFHDHSVMMGNGRDAREYRYSIPICPKEMPLADREAIIIERCALSKKAMNDLAVNGNICVTNNANRHLPLYTEQNLGVSEKKSVMYQASEFHYFANSAEEKFLKYGTWEVESSVVDRIEYTADIQLAQTKEDVSALYGEAVVYMLQWERKGFCPNIETVVNDGIIAVEKNYNYKEDDVSHLLAWNKCLPLSPQKKALMQNWFIKQQYITGKALVPFLNEQIQLKKKRVSGTRIIYFPVKIVEKKRDNEQMESYLCQIKDIYNNVANKSPMQWMYLANAVMAFGQYHEKWNQIGTDPDSYDKWVEPDALLAGLSRLSNLMKNIPISDETLVNEESMEMYKEVGGKFEREISYQFHHLECIESIESQMKVIGVQGVCDWIGKGLVSKSGTTVDLLEIKFVHEIANINRLQVLAYCALFSLEKKTSCSGMLYNARTGEVEICSIEAHNAKRFLYDIASFKHSGTEVESAKQKIKSESTESCKHTSGSIKGDNADVFQSSFTNPVENEIVEIDGAVERGIKNKRKNPAATFIDLTIDSDEGEESFQLMRHCKTQRNT